MTRIAYLNRNATALTQLALQDNVLSVYDVKCSR